MMMSLLQSSFGIVNGAAFVFATLVLILAAVFRAWNGSSSSSSSLSGKANAKLPAGSSWYLPWVGESLIFFRDGPRKFSSHRIARYGRTFRTHLMGNPTIVFSTPKAARFVLGTQQRSFLVCRPPSILRLLSLSPDQHRDLSPHELKTLYDSLRSDSLRSKLPKIDKIVRWALSSWGQQPPSTLSSSSSSSSCDFNVINTHQEAKKIAYHAALYSVAGMWPSPETMKIVENYDYIAKGMATPLQFDIPGTRYHFALEKRKPVVESFFSVVKKRLSMEKKPEKLCALDSFMDLEIEEDDGRIEKISEHRLVMLLVGFAFGGSDSSAALLVWLVKFLAENQHVLEEVKIEQDKIRQGKVSSEDPLSWTDITNEMPFSSAVLQETLRLASVVSVMTRKAVEDINYEGTSIPKGWFVQLDIAHFHLSPEYHNDPLKFDPSRFQGSTKPTAYMPFGNGSRMCPGRELLKMEALVFLHYLVTTYRWETIGSGKEVNFWPSPVPKGGLPIRVSKLDQCELIHDL